MESTYIAKFVFVPKTKAIYCHKNNLPVSIKITLVLDNMQWKQLIGKQTNGEYEVNY